VRQDKIEVTLIFKKMWSNETEGRQFAEKMIEAAGKEDWIPRKISIEEVKEK
jgi:hypothetical protein